MKPVHFWSCPKLPTGREAVYPTRAGRKGRGRGGPLKVFRFRLTSLQRQNFKSAPPPTPFPPPHTKSNKIAPHPRLPTDPEITSVHLVLSHGNLKVRSHPLAQDILREIDATNTAKARGFLLPHDMEPTRETVPFK